MRKIWILVTVVLIAIIFIVVAFTPIDSSPLKVKLAIRMEPIFSLAEITNAEIVKPQYDTVYNPQIESVDLAKSNIYGRKNC